MSDQSTNVPASSDQPGSNIQRLPVPESRGPVQHEQMPMPLQGADAIHNYFLRNLRDEAAGQYTPGAYSADPAVTPDRGQPPRQEVARSGDIPRPGTEEQRQLPAEQVTRQPGQPAEDSQQTQQQTPPLEQPPESYGEVTLEVDGQRITADDVKQLQRVAEDARHLQKDYTQKTQLLSRVRQETEALGLELTNEQQALERRAGIIHQVVNANLAAYEQADVRSMTQEQYAAWQQQSDAARRGKEALDRAFAQADAEYQDAKDKVFKRTSSSTAQLLRWHEPRWDKEHVFYGKLREFAVNEGLMSAESFDKENDFLRIVGLIGMMDRHTLPETIRETRENPRPPDRQHEQRRDSQGRFQNNVAGTTNAVLNSQNARQDGSAHSMFMARLEDERRRGVPPQPNRVT